MKYLIVRNDLTALSLNDNYGVVTRCGNSELQDYTSGYMSTDFVSTTSRHRITWCDDYEVAKSLMEIVKKTMYCELQVVGFSSNM